MGRVTWRDQVINQLIVDYYIFSLNEKESLEYITKRLGKQISGRTYRRYKKILNDDEMAQSWVNQHTKVGFLTIHRQIIDVIDIIQKDTLRDYLIKTRYLMTKKPFSNTIV
jgi:hypothetical protein